MRHSGTAFLLCALSFTAVAQKFVPPAVDLVYQSYLQEDFARFNPAYKELRGSRVHRASILGERVFEQERQRRDVACAHQILSEIKWLIGSTADFARIDRRLDDLQHILAEPEEESRVRRQDPADGSWGSCYTEWFFKLDATYDYLEEYKPIYPLHFLDRVNSPEKLREYFSSIAISDIARNGVDHRRELNESLADLVRLILRDKPAGHIWSPEMKATILQIVLSQVRNPITGWWGERYRHDGEVYFVDDISVTFHMVNYLFGKVPDLPKIVNTELALKDLNYPQGWLDDGRFSNHNNMDAVVLFRYGWTPASPGQRRIMAGEIQKMLDWCLTQSLRPDGSFRTSSDDDSVEESEYFGTAFLSRAGFFDKSRRFWTDREFLQADGIRQRIRGYITKQLPSGAAGGAYYRSALQQLETSKSRTP